MVKLDGEKKCTFPPHNEEKGETTNKYNPLSSTRSFLTSAQNIHPLSSPGPQYDWTCFGKVMLGRKTQVQNSILSDHCLK